ncbi:prepilin-type N-terminal cleavage/methylation domain-containing protein [Sporolactobacillus shoreae]|uniref:Prepilin-type N-terminal cleavage/methylation domain-containing protein n=1 Tax=Sporolactobacillus shoreae TaxID=1465501 RepID=A0A4Z0GSA0_9BACL|nr:prepilin-type N-terminal cleavage/methylation domain-containing protein [Sporolactobacillus shoreae]
MVHNNKGVTLVELLAVLALATICFVLIFSIWLSGQKSADHTMTENDLQSDANLVQKRLTDAFYDKNQKPFTLSNINGQVAIQYVGSSQEETISSDQFVYSGTPTSIVVNQQSNILTIDYDIQPKKSAGNSDLSFQLKTTLNYPWNDDGSGTSQ